MKKRIVLLLFLASSFFALTTLSRSSPVPLLSDPPHGAGNTSYFFTRCLNCHPPQGLANGTDTCLLCHEVDPLFWQYAAAPMRTHGSAVTGTNRFEYDLDCTACHHPHDQQQNWAFGTTYGKYVRTTIDQTIQVTDFTVFPAITFTKIILSSIEFTHPTQFIDGDSDYTEDICSTCHTLTNHHQNDGSAPGGQSHYDGTACTTCHTHETGFAVPDFQLAPPPHDVFACTVCHDTDAQGNLLWAYPGAPIPSAKCNACHAPGTPGAAAGGSDIKLETHHSDKYQDPTTGALVSLECVECHNPMSVQYNQRGNVNLDFVRSVVRGNPVVFEATSGPYSFAYDLPDRPPDMSTTNYVCNTCHTQTNHHQAGGGAPGGQTHFDGADCASCHGHDRGFVGFAGGPHPQAQTNCSNCHLDPLTGEPDLVALHGSDCALCHTTNFSPPTFTFIGPLGSWGGDCSDCHNPFYSETGNMDVPTRGHRCIVCHGDQLSTNDVRGIHYDHTEAASCDVCHGFVPDTGVAVGSGNRDNCHLCHGTSKDGSSIRRIHKEMVPAGTNCIECHSDGRPPVGVTWGPPVGSSRHVCKICHSDEDPSEWQKDSERYHEKHADELLDCGACHMDAHLQDDWVDMPPVDDSRRSMVNRFNYNECGLCHEGGESGSVTKVHRKHVSKQTQWCFNCHDGADGRPLGLEPPVTEPRDSCRLCHSGKTYNSLFPFDIHKRHVDKPVKCYACHQAVPQLLDWPKDWMR